MDLTQSEFPSLDDLDAGGKKAKRAPQNTKIAESKAVEATKLEKKESSDSFEDL